MLRHWVEHQIQQMIGDCKRRGCGHSIAYHLPMFGCAKCDCEEFK